MLRSLGQNPTDEEIKQMIEHFDDGTRARAGGLDKGPGLNVACAAPCVCIAGDKDGKIQLREFLQMYVSGLDSKK